MKAQAAAEAEKLSQTKSKTSETLRCMDCNKTFGTAAALDNHYQSKKHKEHVMNGRSEQASSTGDDSKVVNTAEVKQQEVFVFVFYLIFFIFILSQIQHETKID